MVDRFPIKERYREVGRDQDEVRPGRGPPVRLTAHAAFQLRQLLFLPQVVILRARHRLARDEAETLRLRAASIKH